MFATIFLDVTHGRSNRRVLPELLQFSLGHDISGAAKIDRMMKLGLEFFGLDVAIVTEISGDRCEIKHVQGNDPHLDVGAIFSLKETLCARTILADEPIATHNTKESEFANDPGYRAFGFEAYIGCSLLVEGVCDGTVSFVSATPREREFTENDRMIMRLFAQWCSTEILRLRSEVELQSAQDRLIDAVESLPDAFILFDSEQKLALSNSKYLEFFPSAREFLEPGTDVKILAQGLEQTFQVEPNEGRDVSRTMDTGQIQNMDDSNSGQIVQVSDGRWLSFSERRTGNGGLVGLCKDVTELISTQEELAKARDSAEAANHAKSEFLSSMSHELRTPMNSILGFGQLLNEDPRSPLDANQERYVGQILRSGNHLLHLIDEVLDLSKIELGNLEINSEVLDLGEILDECVSTAEALSASRGVSIIASSSSQTPPKIYGDRVRTSQVLLNVLSNAIKYNRDDGRVTVEWELLPDGLLRISIADTGRGIPEKFRKRVFQPFSRLPTNRDDTEGNGIGLALSKRLMENMEGRIDFTSVPEEGATFNIDFPLAKLEDVERPSVNFENPSPATESDVAGKILYVEDNPANLELMEEIVRRISGVKLLSAHTAEIGLTIARKDQPRLILMDINLPGMDGFEALEALQGDQQTKDIPIIALTANAMPADVERGEKAGFQHYLTKPIKVAEVSRAIKEALERQDDVG
ncbi:MAG: response regulator [Rhodospirillaceae bacterium]|nr:response regulator [Rhodospirillaceae bacterium]